MTRTSHPLFVIAGLAIACGGSAAGDPSSGGSGGQAGASASGGTGSGAQGGSAGKAGGGGGSGSSGATCEYGAKTYSAGESFPADDGCNTCSCNQDGSVGCTLIGCGDDCFFEGKRYAYGESFTPDGCNTCSCELGGNVACTELACGTPCVYLGTSYPNGSSFASRDGCNQCTCSDGSVSCTEIACKCDPDAEWWRSYVATDPKTCAVIDYACTGKTTGFENQCGCGCEQDASCPRTFDCMPPSSCNVPDIQERCPFSTIAY